MTEFQELGEIELMSHPVCNHDLALSDYHLFQSMAHFLRGGNFENFEVVEISHAEFFSSNTKDWNRRRIINLAKRWLKTI